MKSAARDPVDAPRPVLKLRLYVAGNSPNSTIAEFEWLSESRALFDLMILDPPSFAKRASERTAALNAYGKLMALGINRLADKGILLAASCSAHVTAEEFFELVRQSALKSGPKFVELQTTRHPPDLRRTQ